MQYHRLQQSLCMPTHSHLLTILKSSSHSYQSLLVHFHYKPILNKNESSVSKITKYHAMRAPFGNPMLLCAHHFLPADQYSQKQTYML
uniref:Uncharacterized protein n=1 Tax=Populus trichocarpa TaxID=3694 RepID=U5GPM2_POPTR